MQGAEQGAVADGAAEDGRVLQQLVFGDPAQDVLPEEGGDRLHFRGDRGVIGVEIGVVAAGVDDHQIVARPGEREGDGLDHGRFRIGEVDVDEAADGARRLIHQSARLPEPDVLGILRDLRDLGVVGPALSVEVVQDIADHHLKRRRGRDPRPFQDFGDGVGDEPPDGKPAAAEPVDHPGDQGAARKVGLRRRIARLGQFDPILGIALALQPDLAVALRRDGDDVAVDRPGKHAAVVMVGVVARDLAPSGDREEADLVALAVEFGEAFDRLDIPLGLGGDIPVQVGVLRERSALQFFDQFFCVHVFFCPPTSCDLIDPKATPRRSTPRARTSRLSPRRARRSRAVPGTRSAGVWRNGGWLV